MTRPFGAASPPTASAGDTDAISMGVEFYVTAPAQLTHIHFWQPTTGSSAATRKVAVYTTTNGTTGTQVVAPENLAVTGSGWQTHPLASPLALTPGTRYRAVVFHPAGQYVATPNYFISGGPGYGTDGLGITYDGYLTLPGSTDALNSGQMSFTAAADITFPVSGFNGGNYWIDITVETDAPAPIVGFAAHNGTEWVQGHGWAHNGAAWQPADPAIP